jgi:uncharacterized protein YlxW (UPF0749 family)
MSTPQHPDQHPTEHPSGHPDQPAEQQRESAPDELDQPDVPPEPAGKDRVVEALRRPWSRGQAIVGVLLAVLGFAAVVQVRANDADENFTGVRQGDLISLINTLSQATDRARLEIADLRRTRDSLLDDTEATRTALAVARQRAEVLGILSGTVPAIGPGIRITVDADPGAIGTDQILNGLQELRDSGAEAIEINDTVRVVASSYIQDAPNQGLLVDGIPIDPPFVVDAIGEPATLTTALTFPGGFIVEIEQVGGVVEVEESERIEIASVRDVPTARYAQPVPEE